MLSLGEYNYVSLILIPESRTRGNTAQFVTTRYRHDATKFSFSVRVVNL